MRLLIALFVLILLIAGFLLERFVSFIELSGFSRKDAFTIIILTPIIWAFVPPIPFGEINSLEIFLSPAGFIVPFFISIKQIFTRNVSFKKAFVGILILTLVCNHFSNPTKNGVGISNPYFPVVSAIIYSMLVEKDKMAPLAYIIATIGMFIGADVLNLPKLNSLVTSYVTIGGAGIFDAIYLTGLFSLIISVIIVNIKRHLENKEFEL